MLKWKYIISYFSNIIVVYVLKLNDQAVSENGYNIINIVITVLYV